jgi:predicted DNA-binding transcriptional regulator YafY
MVSTEPRRWTRRRLAEHWGVSERAIDFDLQALRAAGYPIRRHEGDYAIDESERKQ